MIDHAFPQRVRVAYIQSCKTPTSARTKAGTSGCVRLTLRRTYEECLKVYSTSVSNYEDGAKGEYVEAY